MSKTQEIKGFPALPPARLCSAGAQRRAVRSAVAPGTPRPVDAANQRDFPQLVLSQRLWLSASYQNSLYKRYQVNTWEHEEKEFHEDCKAKIKSTTFIIKDKLP